MTREQVVRRLAAIVAADVVGYSRLIGADETGTLARLATLRRDIVDHAIARPGAAKSISFRDIFCNNFWITTSGNFSNPALMCCVQEMGVDRILFAVDWPFVVNSPGVEWMKTVPLCDEDKAKILSGNAKRLLRM